MANGYCIGLSLQDHIWIAIGMDWESLRQVRQLLIHLYKSRTHGNLWVERESKNGGIVLIAKLTLP